MGYTKIWSIKTRLDTSIGYIENPEKTKYNLDLNAAEKVEKYIIDDQKTEKGIYVETFNCGKDAYRRMMQTQEKYGKYNRKNGVIGYHIVQSFKDFETTPEIAHECGVELAKRLFADSYEVVVATHLNCDHLHNHIIINSVSFVDGKKYRNSFKDYFKDIRGISDEICREHCLTVIEPKSKGKHYAEWKALKEGKPTIRGQIRDELDEIIKSSYTMKDFWRLLEKRGYVMHRKGENIKHTSIIAPYAKRPVRLDGLGKGYTEEEIAERIMTARNGIRTASSSELPKNLKRYKVKGDVKNHKYKKLKGFTALYFYYLYLFGKIRKKQTPQRVSFFMRDELTKLERYQKQFKFMYRNNIETVTELTAYHKGLEEKVNDLVNDRTLLYKDRTDENFEEVKEKASKINAELNALRKEMRMCKAIYKDAQRISEKYKQAEALQKQAEQELMKDEHKRRSR